MLGEGAAHDDDVAGVLAGGDAGQHAAGGQAGGHVLEAVDDEVDLAGDELGLQLVRPQALAPELVQRRLLVLVPRRVLLPDLELDVRVLPLQRLRHPLRLPQGQLRLPRPDPHRWR